MTVCLLYVASCGCISDLWPVACPHGSSDRFVISSFVSCVFLSVRVISAALSGCLAAMIVYYPPKAKMSIFSAALFRDLHHHGFRHDVLFFFLFPSNICESTLSVCSPVLIKPGAAAASIHHLTF